MENSKENPWKTIPAEDYEAHMSHGSVLQLQKLNMIFKEQYTDYRPRILVVFGICTGNGLEHVDAALTKTVYGIDVNEEYLSLCRYRYSKDIVDLRLISMDCNKGYLEKLQADLIIANLFLEYVEISRFLSQIEKISHECTVISVVLQCNRGEAFVSDTGIGSLKALDDCHRDIDAGEFKKELSRRGFSIIKESASLLPNNKEFLRLDFSKQRPAT